MDEANRETLTAEKIQQLRVETLAEDLGSSDRAVRDGAMEQLSRMGWPAASQLRAFARAMGTSPWALARYVVSGLHLERQFRRVHRQEERFSTSFAGSPADAAAALARVLGYRVEVDPPAGMTEVKYSIRDLTALEVMDEVALQNPGLAFRQRSDATYLLHAGAPEAGPRQVRGPLRVSMTRIEQVRTSDFTSHAVRVSATLRLEVDRNVHAVSDPVLVACVMRVGDDRELPAKVHAEGASGVFSVGCEIPDGFAEVESLRGAVDVGFASGYVQVVLDDLKAGAREDVAGLRVEVREATVDRVVIVIAHARGSPEAARVPLQEVLAGQVIMLDGDGRAAIAAVKRYETVNPDGTRNDDSRWGLSVEPDAIGPAREVRLRVATGVTHVQVPFDMGKVALP